MKDIGKCEGSYRDYINTKNWDLIKCPEVATDIHHKNRNRADNRPSNLMKLCRKCHKREHQGETGKGYDDELTIDAYDEIRKQKEGYRLTRGFSMLGMYE